MLSFNSFCKTLLAVLLVQVAVRAQTNPLTAAVSIPGHPRLLLLKGEEEGLKRSIGADKSWEKLHQAVLTECDQLVSVEPLKRIQIGRRLLDKSREALRRIFYLSYAWRMTRQEKYLKRAETELLTIAAFSDWNPSHFLDVAEMTMAVSIGYDWLYNDLSEQSRLSIKEAILKKGIEPSLDTKYNSWLKSTNNWNQVCNAGITYAAIALYEDQPEQSRTLINRAVTSVVLPMGDYKPDGAYPEGYSYWGYGTSFNVMLISALDKLFGSDFGLSAQPGFLQTAAYLENMTGPSGNAYNYSDSGLNGELQPAMFWFAKKRNDPSLLWVERSRLMNGDLKKQLRDRLLPAALLWGNGIGITRIKEPKSTMWVGEGKTPVALMRTSWSDPAAIFVGIKGGSPSTSHAHMDVGSFVMEADGVRWAMDFGMQEYESLESKGVDLWNMRQNSQRWQILRYNNFAHNTLSVNDELQAVDGKAPLTAHSSSADFMSAQFDLSSVYRQSLTKASRGIAIVDNAYVVVQDELETSPVEATVRWTLLTPANVKLTGTNRVELTKDGKVLTIQVTEPAQIDFKTWPTVPVHEYDAPNPGTTLVGFDVKIPANTKSVIRVILMPGSPASQKKQAPKPLAQWPR
ncbi:heparinase II/III domain-containing protein [Spirosoma linguale]|uniref:Heparinase II/III family protein n=1 Tax=Spirosoma linguale (strain ATCC 33905 / DSM 74 / LMG 10896 / Claus 1) TaxID=504472 RepID=D2QGG7_SPILD|nr:Heparinase II/III family protein [Spirosoma linguale DSM 74]